MLDAFARQGEQLSRAYADARSLDALDRLGEPRGIAVCAMGGSAAAGDLVAAAFGEVLGAPLVSVRGYLLPGWVRDRDLVICVSYSGNTEETLACYEDAVKRGAAVVAVCAGGELAGLAGADGRPVVPVPGDAPVPRAALGGLVGALLGTLEATGAMSPVAAAVEEAGGEIAARAERLGPDVPSEGNEAKQIAAWVGNRVPVIWGSEGVSAAAAWRWKTAFNENAEVPAFSSSLPELDHHEVVGWAAEGSDRFALIVLRESGEHERVTPRLDATLRESGALESREVAATGANPLARGLALSLVGDLASAYHALGRGIDPAAMDPITRVKRRLAGGG